jgi:ATP-dependent helicase/nuclease subunit B
MNMVGSEKKLVLRDGYMMTDPLDAAAYLAGYDAEETVRDLGLTSLLERLRKQSEYQIGNVSEENIHKLYGKVLDLSASKIDVLADCRFKHFMNYGLRAKELKEAGMDPAEFGTYFHYVMEMTAKKVMELGGFHHVSLENTLELAKEYSSQYILERFSTLDTSRLSYMIDRNIQELLCLVRELWEELHVSLFEPDQFEVEFGDKAIMPSVIFHGKTMDASLGGKVDRVDKWNDGYNNYFRVVDYKSGKKAIDYCDLYNGLGLQMLLYMYALEQGGDKVLGHHPVPAGVQYFSARYLHMDTDYRLNDEDAAKERGKELVRKGIVLSDSRVLKAMQPDGAPIRLAAQIKDDKVVGDIADREQFRMLKTYIFRVVEEMVDQVSCGNVEANPYTRGDKHNACRYCPFGAVCHKNTVEGRRNYAATSAKRFWEDVDKEVNEYG